MQTRTKWTESQSNLKLNELVLIKDNLLPPAKWKLGRVIQVHPGQDSLVRVATIRTATTTLKRPIAQLCRLPIAVSSVP